MLVVIAVVPRVLISVCRCYHLSLTCTACLTASQPFAEAEVMDDYVILRVLGEGTFGRVYLARHLPTSALVALKKVRIKRAEEGLPKVLMREIQALEKLAAESTSRLSRHIVRLREHFAQGSAVVLVLEYMQADLQQVMQALTVVGQRMNIRTVQACMRQILTGVAGMHEQRVMHRVSRPLGALHAFDLP